MCFSPFFSLERNAVIFSAGIGVNSPFGPFDTDVTMIYDKTLVNIGNAYSPVTGKILFQVFVLVK